jgi:isoaspartyl peptidase/L-asparaginase-like protein (Ntn-hydrolase superfamily)
LEQSVASQIAVLIRDAGFSFRSALEKVIISRLPKDTGGVIAVNANHEVLMPYNTGGMIRGSVDNTGTVQVGIHAELASSTLTL